MSYRSVLYLKLKLKTFYFDLIFSDFWPKSILHEIGSNKVVSFFLFQTLRFFWGKELLSTTELSSTMFGKVDESSVLW